MTYSKIDIHSHYLTPGYTRFCQAKFGGLAGDVAEPQWRVTDTLKLMAREQIEYSILSVSMPHISYQQTASKTAALAAEINAYGGRLHRQYPQKLSFFATVPVPFIAESLVAVQTAIMHEHAAGVVLPTSAQGLYLGNQHYDPLMALLNQIGAVVLVHPNDPPASPYQVVDQIPHPIYDFFAETTKAFLNMEQQRIFLRYPNIKFIIPHGGAALAVLAPRMLGAKMLNHHLRTDQVDTMDAMRHVYFDVAGRVLPSQLPALLQVVRPQQLLYASDFPYTPMPVVLGLNTVLAHTHWLTMQQKQLMYHENAFKLFK